MFKQNYFSGTAELAAAVFYFAASLFPSGRENTCPESTGDPVTAEVESPPQPMLEK